MSQEEFNTQMAALKAEYDSAINDRNECDKRKRAAEKSMQDLKDAFIKALTQTGKKK